MTKAAAHPRPHSTRRQQRSVGNSGTPPLSIQVTRERISAGVPDHIKIAIFRAITAFSEMEAFVEMFIWEMTGLSFNDGRLITTRLDAKVKFDIAKSLARNYGLTPQSAPPGTLTIWSAMDDLIGPRNKIVHGLWATIDLKIPVSASYKIAADPDQMAAESFPLERLEAIERQSRKIKECLESMIAKAGTLRSTLAAPSRQNHPSPQPVPTQHRR